MESAGVRRSPAARRVLAAGEVGDGERVPLLAKAGEGDHQDAVALALAHVGQGVGKGDLVRDAGSFAALHDAVGRRVEHVDAADRRVGHDAETAAGSEAEGAEARLGGHRGRHRQALGIDGEDLPRLAGHGVGGAGERRPGDGRGRGGQRHLAELGEPRRVDHRQARSPGFRRQTDDGRRRRARGRGARSGPGIFPATLRLAVSIAATPAATATQSRPPSGSRASRPGRGPASIWATTFQSAVSTAATFPAAGCET